MCMSNEAAVDRRGCIQIISSTVVSLAACAAYNKPAVAIASADDVASVRAAVDALIKDDAAKVSAASTSKDTQLMLRMIYCLSSL